MFAYMGYYIKVDPKSRCVLDIVNMQTFPLSMPHHLSHQPRIMNSSSFGLPIRAIRGAVKSPKSGLQQTRSTDPKQQQTKKILRNSNYVSLFRSEEQNKNKTKKTKNKMLVTYCTRMPQLSNRLMTPQGWSK